MAKIFVVDAFAAEPFRGNPAGVCPLESPPPDPWMRSVAAELKHSETAFLWPEAGGLRLRWFTPEAEVDLCGHATLATAHVLFSEGLADPAEAVRFSTRSGVLQAHRRDAGIELDFPATVPEPCAPPKGLAEALGVAPEGTWLSRFDVLALLSDEGSVRDLAPDFRALRSMGVRGVIVTARAEGGRFDFVSRFFAPGVGIDEDPVTGSAHCALGPFWAGRLGRSEFTAFQASARGGVVGVRLEGDRVFLTGEAVTVLRGDLAV
jgi:PhzF family phenazine biosynthesis protein